MKLLLLNLFFIFQVFANCHVDDLRCEYSDLLINFKKYHVQNPNHLINLVARKFINQPDWEKALAENITDPRLVYKPSPDTWNNWYRVNLKVEQLANQAKPLKKQDILSWNSAALFNTISKSVSTGTIKNYNNYGKNLCLRDALTTEEINNLKQIKFSNPKLGLKWVDLVCLEDYPTSYTVDESGSQCHYIYYKANALKFFSKFWEQTSNEFDEFNLKEKNYWFWFACWPREKRTLAKRCGMVVYPEAETIENEFDQIIREINNFNPKASLDDAATFALKMQQRLVALHPFNKGNGRVSRWILEYILTKAELPFILLDNMDKDLTIAQKDITKIAIDGMAKYLFLMRQCLNQYKNNNVKPECLEFK